MADALSDRAWADICEAAKLIPDADARAEIETVLFVEYPAFNYNAEAVAAAHRRGLSMLRHCAALAALHGQAPHFAAIKQERNTYYIERLRRSALALVIASGAIRRASRGHRDTQREWLVSRLCGIWLDHFHAEALTVTVPSSGGPPGGRLINFLVAAMRLIMPKPPDRETLRKAIDRERRGRDNARQLLLDLRQRSNGILTREKYF